MNKTIVEINKDYTVAKITKDSTSIFIIKLKKFIIIADYKIHVNGERFIKLIKEEETEEKSYYKFMYLIGKMCKKEQNSKYFNNPKINEHFINGSFNNLSYNDRKNILKNVDIAIDIFQKELGIDR